MPHEQGPDTQDCAAHTPGPWEYVEEYGSRVVADGVGFSAPYRLTPGSGPCPRQNADNRLIAAAPDLLEALRAALGDSMCDGDLCGERWHELAREAIYKAEGRIYVR